MKNVMLFINGNLGSNLLQYLISDENTTIVAVIINGPNKVNENYPKEIRANLARFDSHANFYQYSKELWQNSDFLEDLRRTHFGISGLFGHIFPQNIIDHFDKKLINLHPSLLPLGRGADPIFWSMVEGLPQGATIHLIDKGIDTGEILSQEEVILDSWLTSGEIYEKVSGRLFELFKSIYPHWSEDSVFLPQLGVATEHHSRELAQIKHDLLTDSKTVYEVLNLVQALTYSDNRKMQLRLPNHEIWEVELKTRRVE
jgi:methionyl-tRNA formyltransferase